MTSQQPPPEKRQQVLWYTDKDTGLVETLEPGSQTDTVTHCLLDSGHGIPGTPFSTSISAIKRCHFEKWQGKHKRDHVCKMLSSALSRGSVLALFFHKAWEQVWLQRKENVSL